jgi:hypothetical protein
MLSLKRKRNLLYHKQEREIISCAKENPKLTQQQIADNFTIKWDLLIKRRTVGVILNKKEFHESDNEGSPSRKRHRSGLNADTEQCLYLWFANAMSKNVPLTDEFLKEKAKHFGDETGVTDSNGWLQRKTWNFVACNFG